jgi:hypothetical protein
MIINDSFQLEYDLGGSILQIGTVSDDEDTLKILAINCFINKPTKMLKALVFNLTTSCNIFRYMQFILYYKVICISLFTDFPILYLDLK